MTCKKCSKEVAELNSRNWCRPCYNADMSPRGLARYHQRRNEAITMLGGACAKCGAVDRLEFDHVERASKTHELGYLFTQSKEATLEELKKCQLLCKPCHTEKTRSERTVGHGGGLSGIKNCKCGPCRARKREYMLEWKRKRRNSAK